MIAQIDDKPGELVMTRANFRDAGILAYWNRWPHQIVWESSAAVDDTNRVSTVLTVRVYVLDEPVLVQQVRLVEGNRNVFVGERQLRDNLGSLVRNADLDAEDLERHYDRIWDAVSELLPRVGESRIDYSIRIHTFSLLAQIKLNPNAQEQRIRDADAAAISGYGGE